MTQPSTPLQELFPSFDEAMSLMPTGRYPYTLVKTAIDCERGSVAKVDAVAKALQRLKTAQHLGDLEPPLTDELESAVDRACNFISPDGQFQVGANSAVAGLLLEAVFEHGYRSDGNVANG